MALRISRPLLDAIRAQAKTAAPHECCGLLFGDVVQASGEPVAHVYVSAIQPVINVAAEPHHRFEVDPAMLIAAHRAARAGGPAIIGHYHSHPAGEAMPSAIDADMARGEGEIWLVVGHDGTITAWRAGEGGSVHGRFEPVELTGSSQARLAPMGPERHESPSIA